MAATKPNRTGRSGADPRPGASVVGLFAAFVIAFAIVAALTGEWVILAALGALIVIVAFGLAVAGAFARGAPASDAAARGAVAREDANPAQAAAAVAGTFYADQDDLETPLGAHAETHDQIDPHDIPRDNPARREAEERAEPSAAEARGSSPSG